MLGPRAHLLYAGAERAEHAVAAQARRRRRHGLRRVRGAARSRQPGRRAPQSLDASELNLLCGLPKTLSTWAEWEQGELVLLHPADTCAVVQQPIHCVMPQTAMPQRPPRAPAHMTRARACLQAASHYTAAPCSTWLRRLPPQRIAGGRAQGRAGTGPGQGRAGAHQPGAGQVQEHAVRRAGQLGREALRLHVALAHAHQAAQAVAAQVRLRVPRAHLRGRRERGARLAAGQPSRGAQEPKLQGVQRGPGSGGTWEARRAQHRPPAGFCL